MIDIGAERSCTASLQTAALHVFSLSRTDEQTSSSCSGSNGSRTPSPQQNGSGSSSGYSSGCSSVSSLSSSSSFSPPPETYSRKVFVGGLPPDIDQGGRDKTAEYHVYNISAERPFCYVLFAQRSIWNIDLDSHVIDSLCHAIVLYNNFVC